MLDAVIFDVDGTLVDTNEVHVRTWRAALVTKNFDVPADRLRPEIGKGGDNLLPSVLGENAAGEHKEALDEAYAKEFARIAESETFKVFDGARELMLALKERGIKIAVATSGKKEFLQKIEDSAGFKISELCDVLVTADDANNSKPAPDLVLAAVSKLGLSPAQCAMIGDTVHDAQSCRHAGVVCLGVLSGGNSLEDLKSAGARAVYESVGDILQNLDAVLETASPGKARLTQDALESLMDEALHAARDGMDAGEAPIGCVLADGSGKIIARGWNTMNATQNKTAHAEIVTFAAAAGKVPLDARDLILVSTLEPCVMCTGAAMEAAIDTIVYGLRAPADSGTGRVAAPQSPESQMPRIVGNILADESRALFEEWLEQNGDTPQASFVKQLLELT